MTNDAQRPIITLYSRWSEAGMWVSRAWLLVGLLIWGVRALPGQTRELPEQEKVFYALGLTLARATFNFDLTPDELDIVKRGLTDGVLGKRRQVKLREYSAKLSALAKERMAIAYAKNTAIGQEYLAKAASKPNSLLTKSGLVMAPLRDGSGSPVTASDTVRAIGRQRLFDGTIVGDEELESEPIVVSLSRTFQCWKEGMSMMKVGGRSRLACPASLTYGERDGPFGTKPGSVLVFDIEILEILRVEESSTPVRTP